MTTQTTSDRVLVACGRCDGSGRIRAYGHVYGGVCFECNGTGNHGYTTQAEIDRKAANRAKAAARREAKAERERKVREAEWLAWRLPRQAFVDSWLEVRPFGAFAAKITDSLEYGTALTERQEEIAREILAKAIARNAEREAVKVAANEAGWFGCVGSKVNLEVTVESVRDFERQGFGPYAGVETCYIVTYRTDEGHVLKTFTSGAAGYGAEAGQRVHITGTVKEHGEYNGTRETTLFRVRSKEVVA